MRAGRSTLGPSERATKDPTLISFAGPDDGQSLAGDRSILAWIDRGLRWAIEIPAAILVAAEILLLSASIFKRYVLGAPFSWSDEVAAALLIWLAMLGSVIALRRDAHMRLTAVTAMLPRRIQPWLGTAATLTVALFILIILGPAASYVDGQSYVTSPSLQFNDLYRAGALEVGTILILAVSVLQIFRRVPFLQALSCVAVIAAVAAGLWLARPLLLTLGNANLLIFFIGVLGCLVVVGVPIGFAFGMATTAYLGLSTDSPLMIIVVQMDQGMSQLILLAVPMFIFLGVLVEMTGLARALVAFLITLIGHIRGGPSYALLALMALVSGISGSKAADMAAVAPILFPEMKKRNVNLDDLTALMTASGAMCEAIPPSLVLITIGSVTGLSISALFAAGLLPSLILGGVLALLIFVRSRKQPVQSEQRPSAAALGRSLIVAIPALVLPVIIRYSVVEGVATATEVSTIGIAYAAIIGIFVYRQFDWRRLYPMLVETASLTGAILLVIGTASGMAWALAQSGFAHQLASAMTSGPGGKFGFMAVSILVFIILGSLLEGIPAIVLFGPLLFPAAKLVGVDEVDYAIVVVLAMGIGLFAPPFGVGFYTACTIARVSPDKVMPRMVPYLLALVAGVVLAAALTLLTSHGA